MIASRELASTNSSSLSMTAGTNELFATDCAFESTRQPNANGYSSGLWMLPAIKRHTKATHANSTPATDGRHIAVFFGSEGLYLYDDDGTLLWQKDLGTLDAGYYVVPQAQWGFGSSPIIQDGKVIVQCDVQGGGFIAAF